MPWPMTLAPTNEAVSIIIKKAQDFVRLGEELKEIMVSCKYFA